jgi:hypothetical protein
MLEETEKNRQPTKAVMVELEIECEGNFFVVLFILEEKLH